MSIRIVNYPTRITRNRYNLSDLSWTDISNISQSGEAPFLLKIGDTKDGATLIDTTSTTCIFALNEIRDSSGRRPYATLCREAYSNFPHLNPPTPIYYSNITTTGWYEGTAYASEDGDITRPMVMNSLDSSLRSVIKTVNKYCRDSAGNKISLALDLYPPNHEEWMKYKDYLPKGRWFWLRDAAQCYFHHESLYVVESIKYFTFDANHYEVGSRGYTDYYQSGGKNRREYEDAGVALLCLLFEV